jgi:hypothetical protein
MRVQNDAQRFSERECGDEMKTANALRIDSERRLAIAHNQSSIALASIEMTSTVASKHLETYCEFSLIGRGQVRNALNAADNRSQGTADSPRVACAAIKQAPRGRCNLNKHKRNKRERS